MRLLRLLVWHIILLPWSVCTLKFPLGPAIASWQGNRVVSRLLRVCLRLGLLVGEIRSPDRWRALSSCNKGEGPLLLLLLSIVPVPSGRALGRKSFLRLVVIHVWVCCIWPPLLLPNLSLLGANLLRLALLRSWLRRVHLR